MKAIELAQFRTPLSALDLWVSMIENWGEANKEYKHCGNAAAGECLKKMSKYLSRMFQAMRLVRTRLPTRERLTLLSFGKEDDPEYATLLWLRYKKRGKNVLPTEKNSVKLFLKLFQCNALAGNTNLALSVDCLLKIHNIVNDYNTKLAGVLIDKPGTF